MPGRRRRTMAAAKYRESMTNFVISNLYPQDRQMIGKYTQSGAAYYWK
jgi:uncharacterized protein (DUF1778 family)